MLLKRTLGVLRQCWTEYESETWLFEGIKPEILRPEWLTLLDSLNLEEAPNDKKRGPSCMNGLSEMLCPVSINYLVVDEMKG